MPEESPEQAHSQEVAYERFSRFAELTGMEQTDPGARVEALASLTGDQFLDALSVGVGLLRGEERFNRWDDNTAEKNVVASATGGIDLEPPDDSHLAFKDFFEDLKVQMAEKPDDTDKYAVELYFGIIGTHMFPDGNGRLARAVFHLFKDGEIPTEDEIFTRTEGVVNASDRNNSEAVHQLLKKEGVEFQFMNDLAAREDYDPEAEDSFWLESGLTQTLKYIAAKRVLEAKGQWQTGDSQPERIGLASWDEESMEQFRDAYKQVRDEWFGEYMASATKYAGYLNEQLSGNAEELAEPEAVSLKEMTEEQLSEWFDIKNAHNGSHFMSPTDNERYQDLFETDQKEAIRFLREKWGEYADREFIQSFALVHWVGNSENGISSLEELLGNSRHGVEISTQGFRDEESLTGNPRWMKAKFGVLIDGQVTLASNADIQTNQWHGLQEDDGVKRRKYTEWANRLMTNEANCVSPYEFAVDNWRAVGIVIDPDTPDIDKVIALAREHGLPVIDTQDNDLFADKQTAASATNAA